MNKVKMGFLKHSFVVPNLHWQAAFSWDNKYLALTGRQEDEKAFVWELATGKLLKRPELYGNSFLKFIGKSYSLMGDLTRVWDVERERLVLSNNQFELEPGVRFYYDCYFDHCFDLNQEGTHLLGAPFHTPEYEYYDIGYWAVDSRKLVKRFATPKVKYNQAKVKFMPDGQHFCLVAKNPLDQAGNRQEGLEISIWNIETENCVRRKLLTRTVKTPLLSYTFSVDASLLVVDNHCYKLNTGDFEEISWFLSPHQNYDKGKSANFLDYEPGRFINLRVLNEQAMLVSPDSKTLWLCDLNGEIKSQICTRQTLKVAAEEQTETDLHIKVLAVSPDYRQVAFGGIENLAIFQGQGKG